MQVINPFNATCNIDDIPSDSLGPEITTGFSEVLAARFLVFGVVFVLFHLAIVLPILLRITTFDYPIGVFKLFFL